MIPVIRHTVRLAVRSGALPVACVVMTLLVWIAAYASWQHQRQVHEVRERYNATVRTQWLQQPDRHPHRVSHYGYLAFRDRAPLSFFDRGIDGHTGAAIFLEAHRQNPANFSDAAQSSVIARLGELSPALVFQLIVPLFIFFLGFAVVSAERENGTWALMLAQGVSSSMLLVGKTLGLLAVTAVLVTPGLLACAAAPNASESFGRIAILFAAYAAYFAICAVLAVRVSAASASSRAALSALVLVWVAACVMIPRGLQTSGTAAYPTPSRAQFDARLEADLENAGDSHNPDDPHFAALRTRVLAEHRVARVEELPFNYSAFVMKEAEQISSSAFERRYSELIETFRRQSEPLEMGAWWNPYLAIRRLSMAVSGTDMRHFIGFQRQAETFRFTMIQKLNDLHLNEIQAVNDRAQRVSRDRWSEFPEFRYQPPGLPSVLAGQTPAVISLAAWLVLLTGALLRPVKP